MFIKQEHISCHTCYYVGLSHIPYTRPVRDEYHFLPRIRISNIFEISIQHMSCLTCNCCGLSQARPYLRPIDRLYYVAIMWLMLSFSVHWVGGKSPSIAGKLGGSALVIVGLINCRHQVMKI